MASSDQQRLAGPRPKSISFAVKALFFVAPVAVAAALAVGWKPTHSQQGEVEQGLAQLRCGVETGAKHDEQSVLSHAFYDTSWLPAYGDFIAVSHPVHRSGRLWNPLGKAWLTREQLDLLRLAYKIGHDDGGAAHASLLQAVLMQESIAGQLGRLGHLSAPLGKRSYGVMQVKVVAARDVLSWHPELGDFPSDDQLIARLITDDEFNLRVASAYLKYLRKRTGSDHEALVAYNVGPSAAKHVVDPAQYRYVLGIERYLSKVVMPFNGKFLRENHRVASM